MSINDEDGRKSWCEMQKCLGCGKTIKERYKWYCSEKCRKTRRKTIKKCGICGSEFATFKPKWGRYCSKKCADKARYRRANLMNLGDKRFAYKVYVIDEKKKWINIL